jgi:hypothetical protein
VDFEKCRKASPNRAERLDFRAIDLLDDCKEPTLLVMVIENELGDIHPAQIPSRRGPPSCSVVSLAAKGAGHMPDPFMLG